MKDKKYKSIDDLLDNYLNLKEEQKEILPQQEKAKEKLKGFLNDFNSEMVDSYEANHGFKVHQQLKKYSEQLEEVFRELEQVSDEIKDFLQILNNKKLKYESKDDQKNKTTYLFWVEENELKSEII